MPGLFLIYLVVTALGATDPGTAATADPAAVATVRAYERARIELIKSITPSVVCMFSKDDQSGGGGSGVERC